MSGALGGLFVLVVVVASLLFIVRGARGVGGAARGRSGLLAYRSPSTAGGAVSGVVAAVMASSAANLAQLGGATSVTIGAMVGVLFAILATIQSSLLLAIATAGFALLGAGAAVTGLFGGASCSTVDLNVRIVALVILGGTAAIGIFAAIATGRFHLRSLLAVVGAVRVVMFLASPLGVSIVDLPAAAWIVACIGAALFGWLAGIAPDFSMGLCALVVGITALAASAAYGSPCTTGGDPGDLLTMAGFIACYALCRGLLRAVVRR